MINLLIAIVIILAILVLAKVIRIFELSSELKGEDQSKATPGDNRTQSWLMLIGGISWLAFVVYGSIVYGEHILPPASSVHGLEIDGLMNTTWAVIGSVFFLTHILLISFAFKYYHRDDRRATFFAHSNKLEMIWTVVPTIVLTSLIVYGLSTWSDITSAAPDEAIEIELYGKQFDWTARYAGGDNVLGRSGYRLIDGANTLGISTEDSNSKDDRIVRGEIHIPINKPVVFKFHSRDVIHSAYMPHFRLQMNCVPGMTTQFHMVANKTSADMKAELGNPDFEYLLLCNKVCGAAHYNMQMDVIVESEADYNAWLAGKKTFGETIMADNDKTEVEVIVEEAEENDSHEVEGEEHSEEEHKAAHS